MPLKHRIITCSTYVYINYKVRSEYIVLTYKLKIAVSFSQNFFLFHRVYNPENTVNWCATTSLFEIVQSQY